MASAFDKMRVAQAELQQQQKKKREKEREQKPLQCEWCPQRFGNPGALCTRHNAKHKKFKLKNPNAQKNSNEDIRKKVPQKFTKKKSSKSK